MSESKFVFCENCKHVFEMYADNHINECPLCDVPNSMPEIPECVAKELARRDADIVTLNNRLTDAVTLNSELVEKVESRDERIAEFEAMINPHSFMKFLLKQLRDPELADNYAKACIRDATYKEIIEKQKEIIARLKEDGERLAGKLISMYADEMYECSYCGHGVSKSPDEIEHAPDCPITLHRALMKELK